MKIGILEADRVDREVIGEFGSYADMFKTLMKEVGDDIDFKVYSVIDEQLPEDINECDAYMITGSQYSAYDRYPWIDKLMSLVRLLSERNKKLVGICFGHQVIAQALGGEVEKSKNGWGVGVMAANVCEKKPWMQPFNNTFDLLVTHQDQVVKLPLNTTLLGSNDFCRYSSLLVGENILTFQGHPEFVPGYLVYLLNKRRNKIDKEKYHNAIDSLGNKTSRNQIATWIYNFIG